MAQRKPTVGVPDDTYEREAEHLADHVMRMPEPEVRRSCACGGECPTCKDRERRHGTSPRQVSRASSGRTEALAPPIVDDVLSAAGRPLDETTREFFEPRFGHDFGNVRIHTDAEAAASAQAVNALAYTTGNHIVFGNGTFAPGTESGRRLIAHELTHVVQQGAGTDRRVARVPTRDGIEEERYVYSTNCGWIDWSHADPSLAAALISEVRAASDYLRKPADERDQQTTTDMQSPMMTAKWRGIILSSSTVEARLLRPLSDAEVLSVALSIFRTLSTSFEAQQEWTDMLGESSFSQEDLPSNLISFYMAAEGYTRDDIAQYCDAWDVPGSTDKFDEDHDFERNRLFIPGALRDVWPAELSTINDNQASALYEITSITAMRGAGTVYTICPRYRVVGTIDQFTSHAVDDEGRDVTGEEENASGNVTYFNGTKFTEADDLRVVPTYSVKHASTEDFRGVPFIEVEPDRQGDNFMLGRRHVQWPLYIPEPMLICMSSHGREL